MRSSTGNRHLWLAALRQRVVWMRVVKVGLPVGILQSVINQGDVWYHHQATGLTLFKTIISPLVTSSVALVAAASTWVEKQQESGKCASEADGRSDEDTVTAPVSR